MKDEKEEMTEEELQGAAQPQTTESGDDPGGLPPGKRKK